ncbi:MAG TPA: hypothetical protein VD793_06490 [Gemmatimonadales bacterium]|nr:hypothetical protein [Gemmatimonadales bacterium]
MAAPQGPTAVHVGNATAVYWPGHAALATALAEAADRAGRWPGLPDSIRPSVRILVAASQRQFDSLVAGRLPAWGAGAAFPTLNTVVVQAGRDPFRVLRHELAHVALHTVLPRPPLWLDEGYAARAAGEWSRLAAVRLNWAVALGQVPTLRGLTVSLRGDAAGAEVGYALAASAVMLLERLGGERGLGPLLDALRRDGDLDQALRQVHQMSLDQFEQRWRRDLRRRFGWLALVGSFAGLWAMVLAVVGALWWRRRRRDAVRRAALEIGWPAPVDEPGASA